MEYPNRKMISPIYLNHSREYALDLLENFVVKKIKNYSSKRNYDFGDAENNFVSYLSPFIAKGILSEREIISRVLRDNSYLQTEKFIQEIFWRTYWRGWLELREKVWYDFIEDIKLLDNTTENYVSAISAKTKIECFNNWVLELKETGYLHNHTRMWFASIWIFTLKIDWQLGAMFFYNHLIDADSASNTLSWRWIAGLQTKGKTYKAWDENIKKYTGSKYYPQNLLSKTAESLPDNRLYPPKDIQFNNSISNFDNSGLIIFDENLTLNHLEHNNKKINNILLQNSHFNPLGEDSSIKINFNRKSLKEYEEMILNNNSVQLDYIDFNKNYVDQVNKWVKMHKIKLILFARPRVGIFKDIMNAILEKSIVKVSIIDRKWDVMYWPHCKKGFFNFKKHILFDELI